MAYASAPTRFSNLFSHDHTIGWQAAAEELMVGGIIAISVCDMLNSTKHIPQVCLLAWVLMIATEEGQQFGKALLTKLICFEAANRLRALLLLGGFVFVYILRGRKSSSPFWLFLLFLILFTCVCSILPFNTATQVFEYQEFLSPGECQRVVSAAEAHGSAFGWTTKRHGNLGTEDIPMLDIGALNTSLPDVLAMRLAPVTLQHFGAILEPMDTFVVRYSHGRQTALRRHSDGGHVTFSVVLSEANDYHGGGVRLFDSHSRLSEEGHVLREGQGNLLMHPSKVMHEGLEIVNGTRYLLISFNTLRHQSWFASLCGLFSFHGALGKELHLNQRSVTELGQRAWPIEAAETRANAAALAIASKAATLSAEAGGPSVAWGATGHGKCNGDTGDEGSSICASEG